MISGSYCLYSGIGLVIVGVVVCLFRTKINGISLGIIWGLAFLTIIGGMILDKFSEGYSGIYEQIFREPMNRYEDQDIFVKRQNNPRRPINTYGDSPYSHGIKKRVNAISHQYRPHY